MDGGKNRGQDKRPRGSKKAGKFFLFSASLLLSFSASQLLHSCATSFDRRGQFHRVQQGETLGRIAWAYRVSLQDLAELNGIEDPKAVTEGQKLYLPPRRPTRPRYKKLPWDQVEAKETLRPKEKRGRSQASLIPESVFTNHSRFHWPVDGKILSGFGIRNGRRHDGIDIQAQSGTPVKAADEGLVVFSNRMSGYGNLVLIRHRDNYFTGYAHNKANLARKGEKVKRGDLIAKVGQTGRATGPHLHFEVREGAKARNPLFFLPVIR